MEAPQEAAKYQATPQRCPFCHEQVQVEQDRWIACAQCLARHHEACWQEAPVCGACSHGVALSAGEPPRPPEMTPVPLEGDAARARSETAALFEQDEARAQGWLDGVVGPLTLGVLPILRAERALKEHHEANLHAMPHQPPEGLNGPVAERWTDARGSAAASAPRLWIPLGLIMLSVLVFGVTLGDWAMTPEVPWAYDGIEATRYAAWRSYERNCLIVGFAAVYGVVLAIHGYLHALRASVRTHERRQLFLQLVSDAVPKEESEALLRATTNAWSQRRVLDSLTTAFGLIPFYGLLLLPVALLRYAGTLAQHHKHEEALRETVRRSGRRAHK